MFVYLNWKNKKGDDLRAMFEESKAKRIADIMKDLGVEVKLSPEEPFIIK